jgi:hypothetical protein
MNNAQRGINVVASINKQSASIYIIENMIKFCPNIITCMTSIEINLVGCKFGYCD